MEALSQELMEKLNYHISFEIPIFGGIPVPESAAVSWLVIAFLAVVCFLCTRNLQIVPTGKRQLVLEMAVSWLHNFFGEILGEEGKRYIPILETMAVYICFSNLVGLVGMATPTKDLNVTVGLALISIFLIEYAGIRKKGAKGFIKSFAEPMPMIAPLNVLEIVIRPLSLCMRLFGNMLGGFVVIELVRMVAPLIVPIPLSLYFDIFDGLLQAYIFVFLTALFMKESLD